MHRLNKLMTDNTGIHSKNASSDDTRVTKRKWEDDNQNDVEKRIAHEHRDHMKNMWKSIDEFKVKRRELTSSDEYKNYKSTSIELGEKRAKLSRIYNEHSSDIYARYKFSLKNFNERSSQERATFINTRMIDGNNRAITIQVNDCAILQQCSQLQDEIRNSKEQIENQSYRNITQKIKELNRMATDYNSAYRTDMTPLRQILPSERLEDKALDKKMRSQIEERYHPYTEWYIEKTRSRGNSDKEARLRTQVENRLQTLRQQLVSSDAYRRYEQIALNCGRDKALNEGRYGEIFADLLDDYGVNLTQYESSTRDQRTTIEGMVRDPILRGKLWAYGQLEDSIAQQSSDLRSKQQFGGMRKMIGELNIIIKEFNEKTCNTGTNRIRPVSWKPEGATNRAMVQAQGEIFGE